MRFLSVAGDVILVSAVLAGVRRIGNFEYPTHRIRNTALRWLACQMLFVGELVVDVAVEIARQNPDVFVPSGGHGIGGVSKARLVELPDDQQQQREIVVQQQQNSMTHADSGTSVGRFSSETIEQKSRRSSSVIGQHQDVYDGHRTQGSTSPAQIQQQPQKQQQQRQQHLLAHPYDHAYHSDNETHPGIGRSDRYYVDGDDIADRTRQTTTATATDTSLSHASYTDVSGNTLKSPTIPHAQMAYEPVVMGFSRSSVQTPLMDRRRDMNTQKPRRRHHSTRSVSQSIPLHHQHQNPQSTHGFEIGDGDATTHVYVRNTQDYVIHRHDHSQVVQPRTIYIMPSPSLQPVPALYHAPTPPPVGLTDHVGNTHLAVHAPSHVWANMPVSSSRHRQKRSMSSTRSRSRHGSRYPTDTSHKHNIDNRGIAAWTKSKPIRKSYHILEMSHRVYSDDDNYVDDNDSVDYRDDHLYVNRGRRRRDTLRHPVHTSIDH